METFPDCYTLKERLCYFVALLLDSTGYNCVHERVLLQQQDLKKMKGLTMTKMDDKQIYDHLCGMKSTDGRRFRLMYVLRAVLHVRRANL